MNNKSRTINSTVNVIVSIIGQFMTLILSFVTRTIFISTLGTVFLGINGLFLNILSILSMADLGMETAMLYTLYKPIVDRDTYSISALIQYYKKIYKIIALTIAFLGVLLIPVLNYIVNTEVLIENVELYYLLFLANTISSYLYAHKKAIINADQRNYLIKIFNLIFVLLRNLFQIIALLLLQSYIIFLIVQIISTLLENYFVSKKADRLYPFIMNKITIESHQAKKVFTNIKALFIYKIGGVILNSTDNILISVIIGTIWVGYYSNYSLIVGAVVTMTDLLFNSLTSSIGNLNASYSNASDKMFKNVNFLNFIVYGFSSIALYALISDFVYLWLGAEFTLNRIIVIAIVLNIYVPGMLTAVTSFRDTTGLFRHTKYIFLVTAILNIVFSIVLGNWFGLAGILFSTFIARMLTNWWYEPKALYKYFFKSSPKSYFKKQVIYAMYVITGCIIFDMIDLLIPEVTYATFTVKMLLVSLSNVCIFLFYRKSDEFKFLIEKIAYIYGSMKD